MVPSGGGGGGHGKNPDTFRLVAQCLNHYAPQAPYVFHIQCIFSLRFPCNCLQPKNKQARHKFTYVYVQCVCQKVLKHPPHTHTQTQTHSTKLHKHPSKVQPTCCTRTDRHQADSRFPQLFYGST